MKPKIKYPNIAAEMVRSGYNQKTLADKLGLAAPSLHYRLYGEIEWKTKECLILCKLFNKDFTYLFEEGK